MKKPKNKKKEAKKYMYLYIGAYVVVFYFALQMGHVSGENILEVVSAALNRIAVAPLGIFPISTKYLLSVSYVYLLIAAVIHVDQVRKRDLRPGEENGSAGWNEDLKRFMKKYSDLNSGILPDSICNIPFIGKILNRIFNALFPKVNEKDGSKNMILSDEVFLSMNTRKTRRNNNILVIGGSGTGKSRFLVKPNSLQANCSFVFTDPSGELLETQGEFLRQQGYKIKVFNLVQMENSNCYNPFNYIRNEEGVLTMINALIQNTTPKEASKGDPFWEKSETALLQAICFFLRSECNKEDQNFSNVMKLLRCAEVKEGQENYESTLDIMFRTLEEREPEHMAVRSYKIFKQAGAKTAQSILISCSVRLQVFNMSAITRLTGTDNIDLASIGDEKTALFCITPVVDTTFNFLVALMYTQLFDALYFHAETECKGKRLPIHVRFMLDEFANIGTIPEFNQKVSTMRKYEISVTIILQALSQIKAMYKDDWEVLVGNCDEQIFLGGSDATTLEYISKKLGKETIRAQNSSRSFGRQGSSSLSYNKTGRELMTPDELAQMDNENCIIFIRGEKPFFSKKYDLERHHNYKLTGDASDEYLYNVKEVFKTTSLEKIRDINTSVNEKLRKKAEKTDTSHAERELRKVREPIRQTSVKGRACYSPNSIADTVKAVTGKDISENATEKEINELLGDELHPSNGYVPKGYDEYDDSSEVKE